MESLRRTGSARRGTHSSNGSKAPSSIAEHFFRSHPKHPFHTDIIDSVQQAQRFCDNKRVCNPYRLTHSKQYLAERFGAADDEIEDRPRYNVAPTQPVLTVRKENGKKSRHFTTMRWGLIPSWAKDMSIGTKTPNARSETVTTTPAFRESILTKRCLIPADGFYEWLLPFMINSRHYSEFRTIAE